MTPDSFSGDGLGHDVEAAVQRALTMQGDGADIVDIGGESTRPPGAVYGDKLFSTGLYPGSEVVFANHDLTTQSGMDDFLDDLEDIQEDSADYKKLYGLVSNSFTFTPVGKLNILMVRVQTSSTSAPTRAQYFSALNQLPLICRLC
jgi:hypothetical protein